MLDSPRNIKRRATPKRATNGLRRTPSFWNKLSKVPLTRGALREFDRRTSAAAQNWLSLCGIALTGDVGTPNLKRFARHGGPYLSRLRGFAHTIHQDGDMSQSHREQPSASNCTNSAAGCRSTYDEAFEQNMIDGDIDPYELGSEPKNLKEVREYLAQPRASLSPSNFNDDNFKEFKILCRKFRDESMTRAEILPIIGGKGRNEYCSAADRLFNHLETLAESLPQAKPDLYDGVLPKQIDLRVRHDIGKLIVPSNNTTLPAAPNFFVEGKGERGRSDVARRQVCHGGAIGARAIHSLRNYKSLEPQYGNDAESYSATYHAGTYTLALYAHHVTAPEAPGKRPEYHMTRLKVYDMIGDIETFKNGAGAFRNLRDLAKSKRDYAVKHANEVARTCT